MADKLTGPELATRLTDPHQVAALLQRFPNPDPVLRKLGRDQQIYEAISYDPHVMGELRSIRAGLLGFEWRVVAGGEGRKARRATDLTRDLMARPPDAGAAWPDVVWTIAQAVFHGYSVHEVLWERDGPYLLPARVVDRPQTRFVFASRDNALRLLTRRNPVWGEELPDRRFLLARHMPSYDNPYGVAVFSACFWPYVFKHSGFRYLAAYAEKFGLPWVVGKYTDGAVNPDELLERLQRLVLDATAVVPMGAEIKIEDGGAGARGATPQERLIALANSELSKALTSQTLATEIQGQGSRAASETHRGRERAVNQSDREIVSATLNRLYRWITDLNLGPDVPAPRHVFYEESEARKEWAGLLDTARHYLPIARSEAYERLGLTPPAEGEELIEAAPAPPPAARPEGAARFRGPAPAQFAAGEPSDPYERALETALADAEDPDAVAVISEDLARTLLRAAAADPEMLLGRLAQLYPQTDASKLQDLLARALFAAETWGRLGADADA